jgi:hypothetical protein
LVLLTAEVSAADLPGYSKNWAMDNALWGNDENNALHIDTKQILMNYTITPGFGSQTQIGYTGVLDSVKSMLGSGSFTYPVEGLTVDKAKDLWWMVERKKPDAIRTLAMVAKQKTPLGTDAVKILTVVKASFAERQAKLKDAPVSMDTVEAYETLLTEGQGLDLKTAMSIYKALTRNKTLKTEFAARSMYQEAKGVLSSPTTSSQAAGKEEMAALAAKYPKTSYGKLAAAFN